MSHEHQRPFSILLVEDNPGDVELVRHALADQPREHRLVVAHDGEVALGLLRAGEAPDLVLLDLNLPALDGIEVLRLIKAEPGLACTPVVVLSSSDAEADVRAAYCLHANAYMLKPPALDGFQEAVRALLSYWAAVVRLPREGPRGS